MTFTTSTAEFRFSKPRQTTPGGIKSTCRPCSWQMPENVRDEYGWCSRLGVFEARATFRGTPYSVYINSGGNCIATNRSSFQSAKNGFCSRRWTEKHRHEIAYQVSYIYILKSHCERMARRRMLVCLYPNSTAVRQTFEPIASCGRCLLFTSEQVCQHSASGSSTYHHEHICQHSAQGSTIIVLPLRVYLRHII